MLRRAIIVTVVACAAIARADDLGDAAPTPVAAPTVAPRGAWRDARSVDDRVRIAAIELRAEASVNDAAVTLRQVCRWPEADEATFAPYAELIVARLPASQSLATLSMETIRGTLRDAGLNSARVNFSGAASCTVDRADVPVDETAALRAWGAQAESPEIVTRTALRPAVADPAAQEVTAQADIVDLKSLLIADVAQRMKLPVDALQVDFRAEDKKVLSLTTPFEFAIEAQRCGDLGDVSWLVTIGGAGKTPATPSKVGDGRRVRIVATARAWMEQLVVARPLTNRQAIVADDVEVQRVLADRMPTDAWVTRQQVVGQQASRDLKVGTPLTARMVAPIELVRPGQLVTVLSRRGMVEVKSVARAMQAGSFGQVVKVKNETTNEVFSVTMTARQTATLGDVAPVVADVR